MERLDFSSVINILRYYVSEDRGISQIDFLYDLFDDYFQTGDQDNFVLDNGLVCRWMNGQAKVSPRITWFYLSDRKNRERFVRHFQETMLPLFYDMGLVITELHHLLIQDNSVSDMQKQKLEKGYPCHTENAQAGYIVSLLLFGMERNFVKRDAKTKGLLESANLSPVVADYIYENNVPKPCRYFCGRDRELELLHEKLQEDGRVFLHGIAGIGKSELAKAYVKKCRKECANILYFIYSRNLMQDITDMDFSDDLPEESDNERFRKHNRFLRSLKEDTLIIIDNFNTTAMKDSFLSVILKYKCRLLFSTRSRMENEPCLLLEEISDKNTLLELAGHYYTDVQKHPSIIKGIIEAVHSHTFAVELAAKLLQSGILEPDKLLEKLKEEKTGLSSTDQISAAKDGINRRETYYGHIHTLFSLYCLNETQTEIMRCLSLVPLSGIPAKLFATVLNLMSLLEIDDAESYLLFLEDAFTYMEKYRYEDGMGKIISEMEKLLKDGFDRKAEDRALLLDYKATMLEEFSHQTSKAVELEKEAIALLPDITAGNALLASNLHANMGGLYHSCGQNGLAAQHMEQGISILEQYGLIHMNQSIAQVCNYAVLLSNMGEPRRGCLRSANVPGW